MGECSGGCGRGGVLSTLVGVGLAATGLAHFVVPEVFRGITETAFPDDVEQATKINGAAETVIGTAIALPKTRRLGYAGLGAYVGYLGFNAVKARS